MFATLLLSAALAQPPARFEVRDGDRVVWVGSTVAEREQRFGYWETALYAAFPKVNFTVRNLGWSGDTVHGESRGRFDHGNADKCFRNLVDLVLELKPTVIFVSYGAVESFQGEAGLPKFEKGLERLLDALKPANARFVLFTPLFPVSPSEGAAWEQRFRAVEAYAKVIHTIAGRRGHYLADLHHAQLATIYSEALSALVTGGKRGPLLENGLHLSQDGYERMAEGFCLAVARGFPAMNWEKLEPLRQAVIAKNELFFHRWRPQNETYLFGFRKHEQGKNAKEVAEFDPLVAKAEEEIAKLRAALTK
jgi:lysophospholipase L1-like esterase